MVKMVFDSALASVCDDKNIFDTCRNSFFNDILDCGFVNNVEHLFGNGF